MRNKSPRSISRRNRTTISVVVARSASSEQTRIDAKYILVRTAVRNYILHPQMNIFTKSTSILRSTFIRQVVDTPSLRAFSSTTRIMAGQSWKRKSNSLSFACCPTRHVTLRENLSLSLYRTCTIHIGFESRESLDRTAGRRKCRYWSCYTRGQGS